MHWNSAFHQCLLLLKSSLMYRIQFEAITHQLYACIIQQGLLFLWELVLIRKQLLVRFLKNVLQSLLATSVPTQHSFMCKKNSLQLHHMWVCFRCAPQRAEEHSQHYQSTTSTITFEGKAQGPPCTP